MAVGMEENWCKVKKKKKRIVRNATKKIAVNNSVLTPLHTSREVNIRIKTFEFYLLINNFKGLTSSNSNWANFEG